MNYAIFPYNFHTNHVYIILSSLPRCSHRVPRSRQTRYLLHSIPWNINSMGWNIKYYGTT